MDDYFSLTKLGKRNQVKNSPSASKRTNSKKGFREAMDQVLLSRTAKTTIPENTKKLVPTEIRQDLVNKFRRDLDKGVYEVRAKEIADKIVQRIRDEKDRTVF